MNKKLILFSLLALLALSGCDGSGWSKTIEAQAYPSGNVLELKYGARQNGGEYAAYGGTKFQSELSPWEMVRRGGSEDFTAEVVTRGGEPAG